MMQHRACIDDTGAYRYKLSRIWSSDKPMVMFIMLNPSTANADVDDRSLHRLCSELGIRWVVGGQPLCAAEPSPQGPAAGR